MMNDTKYKTATAPLKAAALRTSPLKAAALRIAPLRTALLMAAPLTPAPPKSAALRTAPFKTAALRIAPLRTALLIAAPLTPAPLKAAALRTSPLKAAPFRIIALRTAELILLIAATLFFPVGCKTKQTITEKTTTKTDSTALRTLNDSLSKKETLFAILQSDLQRLRDENTRLLNESSTHQISYDTSAPVNPQTGKPPIASEVISLSKSTLEETKKEYETLLQTASLENETLTEQNRNLQLTVEKLINENKQLTEKTTSPGFNIKPFLAGLISGVILTVLIYLILKKY